MQVQSMNENMLDTAVRVQALQQRRRNLVGMSERLRVRPHAPLCI